MNIKYMYEGITLREYCLKNNIDYNITLQKIWRVKNKDKSLTDEKAIEIALDDKLYNELNMRDIYSYQGLKLKEYCENNNKDYKKMLQRIYRVKCKNKDISNNEAVEIALNDELYENYNERGIYNYKGMNLREYCLKNNINYMKIYKRISRLRLTHEKMSNDELVIMALDDSLNKTKYNYQGKSLKKYCEENNISYEKISHRIFRLNKSSKDLTKEQIVEIALNDELYCETIEIGTRTKYYYNGLTLIDYCNSNGINHFVIAYRIYRLRHLNLGLSNDELVESALNSDKFFELTGTRPKTEYYYEGMSLRQYCLEKGINYGSTIGRIDLLKKKYESLTKEEIVEIALNDDLYTSMITPSRQYFYNGMPLKEYCEKFNIKYGTVVVRINNLKHKKYNLTNDQLVKIAISYKNYIAYIEKQKIR